MTNIWILIAIFSAVSISLVNILDSHFITRRFRDFATYMLPVSVCVLGFGLAVFILNPLPEGLATTPLAVAILSGLLRSVSVTITLRTMSTEEVSRIIPVVYSYPIFVAIMAATLLGEELLLLDWVAIFAVVCGAIMVSLKYNGGRAIYMGRSFWHLVLASILLAGADITAKYAIGYVSSWNMFWISSFCMGTMFLAIGLRPRVFRELVRLTGKVRTFGLLLFTESLAMVAAMALFLAISLGPVSLVSAIVASRPIFVLLFAFLFSLVAPAFLEWERGWKNLLLRTTGALLTFGGVAIMFLD
jgi:uncharacterized membrane protein